MLIRKNDTGSKAEQKRRNVVVNMGGTAEAFFRPMRGMEEASFFILLTFTNYHNKLQIVSM